MLDFPWQKVRITQPSHGRVSPMFFRQFTPLTRSPYLARHGSGASETSSADFFDFRCGETFNKTFFCVSAGKNPWEFLVVNKLANPNS